MAERNNILITGCSSGIGRCVAAGLKDRGYRVITSARKEEDVRELQRQGFESLILDLAQSSSIDQAVKALSELTDGRLYGLFN
ncbi:MAG: short-chain dehydrogenase, partial [gamma proteobacterium symbiont of Ctena orbiculata]